MNEEPSDLECELRRLQPIAPSMQLRERLAAVLDHPVIPEQRVAVSWWHRLGFNGSAAALGWGLFTPAAAAGAAAILVWHLQIHEHPLSPVASPRNPGGELAHADSPARAKAINILYQTLDDGVVSKSGQTPVRRVRRRSADFVSWHDAKSGVQWEVSYPREDVLLVPVQAE